MALHHHHHHHSKQRNIVVLGFSLVGKTALCKRFTANTFTDTYEPTYENSFARTLRHNGQLIDLVVTDTQGDDGESVFRNEYGLGYHGYVLAYSITSSRSLEVVKGINNRLLSLTGTSALPRILVGNKLDLDAERQVTTEHGKALATEWGCAFIETSAKMNVHVNDVFRNLLHCIDRTYEPDHSYERQACCFECPLRLNDEHCRSTVGLVSPTTKCIQACVLSGLVGIVCGVVVKLRSHESGNGAFAYGMFGMGMLTMLVGGLGVVGVRLHSRDYLKVCAVSLMATAVCSIILLGIGFHGLRIMKSHASVIGVCSAFVLLAEVITCGYLWRYQQILGAETGDIPYPGASGLLSGTTTAAAAAASTSGYTRIRDRSTITSGGS